MSVVQPSSLFKMCHYTTLWNVSVIKATIENKTTSVTTHFKKLTTGNKQRVYCLSYCLSNCHILQVLHQMFSVSALLLDDALKSATPMTNGASMKISSSLMKLRRTKIMPFLGHPDVIPAGRDSYWQWKSFKNWLIIVIFGKVKAYRKNGANFLGHPVGYRIYCAE